MLKRLNDVSIPIYFNTNNRSLNSECKSINNDNEKLILENEILNQNDKELILNVENLTTSTNNATSSSEEVSHLANQKPVHKTEKLHVKNSTLIDNKLKINNDLTAKLSILKEKNIINIKTQKLLSTSSSKSSSMLILQSRHNSMVPTLNITPDSALIKKTNKTWNERILDDSEENKLNSIETINEKTNDILFHSINLALNDVPSNSTIYNTESFISTNSENFNPNQTKAKKSLSIEEFTLKTKLLSTKLNKNNNDNNEDIQSTKSLDFGIKKEILNKSSLENKEKFYFKNKNDFTNSNKFIKRRFTYENPIAIATTTNVNAPVVVSTEIIINTAKPKYSSLRSGIIRLTPESMKCKLYCK